ncbi:hypothetical protein ADIS_1901 [Lunatimonas lonarensis]|uniref:Uncharacterized protein n=1 Tax=Lunatimonas lonarensis TaxID=1232681 RepID=R7ZUD4_9BACT|nr:hypothetical protein [Lunatimonas lonarensis]EON77682.1 hypothetical protein ADIS_1901 [Lunatimonas lonarensis]
MIKNLKNNQGIKVVCFFLAFSILNMSFIPRSYETVKIPAGTVVTLENSSGISSANLTVGQTIDFFVRDDVKVGGQTVIRRGAPARGQVVRVQKAKGLGKEGSVEVEVKSVQAVDGSEVRLTSTRIFEEGEDRQTAAILLGVLVCILFLTKKGKNAEIAPGTSIDGRVAQETSVEV